VPAVVSEAPVVFNARTLPANDNVNPYAFCVDLDGRWFVQKGRMIAYYGRIGFEALGAGALDRLVAAHFHSPLYVQDWIVAQGKGRLLLADRGLDVNSYDLDDSNLTIRSGNLLAFEPGLSLKQSIIPGFLTLIGTGRFVGASNGPVHFVEPPLRVDPEAVLGWADCPSPCHHYDHAYLRGAMGAVRRFTGLGGTSGEEHQFEFSGRGTVLMQSSETLLDDAASLRLLEDQLGVLTPNALRTLRERIDARLTDPS
jgi:uncharacterized protein (AIM24 family)